jgi:malate dehydrogenase (oxaloacetate-decarboxylating)
MKEVDRALLSLAYTPGVATVCLDIEKDKSKADVFTMRARSAAIVSDGSLFGVSPKEFAPVMDWFVFQLKQYVGFDAYPFLVMPDANLTRVFESLSHTYTTIIYLDNKMDFKVTDKCLFIRHPVVA